MKTNPIELTIVKKTTKNVTFKVKNEDRELASLIASNGIRIVCLAYPQYNTDSKRLYVQGYQTFYDDNESTVSLAEFKKISAAVNEYNEKFGEKPMPKPVEKLSLKIEAVPTNSSSDVMCFRITEQSGFVHGERYEFGGVTFVSYYEPIYHSNLQVLYVQGLTTDRSGNVICVTSKEFDKIKKAINLLNESSPKFIEKITFLYTNEGVNARRCLNVVKKTADSYEGIDEDKGEYRKFLKSKMSKIEVIK